jgi:hypothetical protein
MTSHDDLAHREINKAYDAYSDGNADGNDRVLIVLDLMLHRMENLAGNGNRFRDKVKRQAPSTLGGLGLGAFLLKIAETLF